ncbi:hypothetical protein P7G51_04650 [Enterococcus asini]|uniref:hypothetical protein n=1 Tax=Enterococcus asini TaxID=57732 RepID=UPI0028916011|nr:hypothetical protein [Enterococcus asini]MDT2756673.1 hypothetical protein [Enterococcus asini]
MKASELLTALTLPQKKQNLQGIAQYHKQRMLPITRIQQQEIGLVFISEIRTAPLSMKDLLTILMTHRRLSLYLQTPHNEVKPIYGFKEQDQQIIL